MQPDTNSKTARLDLRMSPMAKSLLEQAAAARHKSVSEFVLEHGLAAAEETLLDRRVFMLNEEQWQEFNRMLDAPPADNPRLRAFLSQKPVWDI